MRFYLNLLMIIVLDYVVTDQQNIKDYFEYETNSKAFPIDKIEDVSEIIGSDTGIDMATNKEFDIPVEILSSSKKVGDIEFDVEVQENKRISPMPEVAVDADPGSLESENLEQSRIEEEGGGGEDAEKAITSDNDLSLENRDDYWPMRLFQANLTDDQNDTTTPKSNQEQRPIGPDLNEKPNPIPDATPTATEDTKSRAVWPLILLAILFTLLVFVGLCWVVTKFLKSRKQKQQSIGKEEEASDAATVATVPAEAETKLEDTSIESGDTKRSPDAGQTQGDDKSNSESPPTPSESESPKASA